MLRMCIVAAAATVAAITAAPAAHANPVIEAAKCITATVYPNGQITITVYSVGDCV